MAEGTRARLVHEAGALLETDGRASVTLRELGRRAGLSRSAPYRHFDGKEGLLTAVAAQGLRSLGEQLAAARDSAPDPVAQLEAMGVAYLRFARANPELYALIFSRDIGGGAGEAELSEAVAGASELFVATVAAGIEHGGLPAGDPSQLAAALLAAIHGAADLAGAGHLEREKWGTDAEGAIRVLLGALELSPAGARTSR
jgi:AcrR family transcriptional regulator